MSSDDSGGDNDNSNSNSSDDSDNDQDEAPSKTRKLASSQKQKHEGGEEQQQSSSSDQGQRERQRQVPPQPLQLIGPTVYFKVSNVVTSQNIPNHGTSTSHIPELNLHGFGTRLGHRVGRFLGSLFPHNAQFDGRQIVTFHNQRDYIFVRHHRYIFNKKSDKQIELAKKKELHEQEMKMNGGKNTTSNSQSQEQSYETNNNIKQCMKTNLQELGPRFTLKLHWIQDGTFDTQFGEYEWFHKRKEMDLTRRKFHL